MDKKQTTAETIMALLSEKLRSVVRLEFFREIARRFQAFQLPNLKDTDGTYYRWRFADGSIITGLILGARNTLGETMLAF